MNTANNDTIKDDRMVGPNECRDNDIKVDESVKVLIVGAGPTGLGGAVRCHEQGLTDNYLLLDQGYEAGGLACTLLTKEGFYFDLGGHVIFSHYQYFDDVLQHTVGNFDNTKHWNVHQRQSYIYISCENQYIPYPYQLHFMQLQNEQHKQQCFKGLQDLISSEEEKKKVPLNFEEWSLASLGNGIHELFMKPYNEKVWAYPMSHLSWTWLSERVASVNLQQIQQQKQQRQQWGPNSTFIFPTKGGTGSIWKRVAQKVCIIITRCIYIYLYGIIISSNIQIQFHFHVTGYTCYETTLQCQSHKY